jgi:hypothetical protein
MRPLSLLSFLAMTAAIGVSGCPASEPADAPQDELTPQSAAVATPPSWYRRVRTIDLTGDGQADSVRLEAVGARPDSLRITLSLLVNGSEKHREAWGSSYELALVDSAARVAPGASTVVRAKLDSVLASVVVQRLDASGVRLMAEDSAALAGLEPQPTHRVSFSYGYETTARLVWDAPRERFVRLWSCC